MKELIIAGVAIVCLTILGVLTKVDSVVYSVSVIIAGIAGHYLPKAYHYLKMRRHE
jgi:hypothetical protein